MVVPPEHFPDRLAELGYEVRHLAGEEVIVPPLCEVPAGAFLMGSDPKRDAEALLDEQPQHQVNLPAYQIARFPVTVAEYACFVRTGGKAPQRWEYGGKVIDWRAQQQRLDHPVVCITWHDAVAYVAWLASVTGEPWRLPTEAEWEKAARGADGRIYPWGYQWDRARAHTSDGGPDTTTPVGTYPQGASSCGAQDMAGNMWEWTSSVYKAYPYNSSDGRERADSAESRVLCGGLWDGHPKFARVVYRFLFDPVFFFNDSVGARLVRAVPGS